MRADKIPNIIDQLNSDNSPYRCIMISGDWGIGKSYQVNLGIHGLKSVGYCSLFGIDNIDDAFTQILFRLTFNRDKSHINLKEIASDLNLGRFNSIKKVLGNVFSPRMILEYMLNQREQTGKPTLIIFDDLERINKNLDFDLFLGTVDLLIQTYKNVKVVFVANLPQLVGEQRNIWEKYSEKVVDYVYCIDDLAENMDLFDIREHSTAALSFMKQHGSKNLRTLQKAQGFFVDVSEKVRQSNFDLLQDPELEQLLCRACYSVVFESVEKIYEREGQRLREKASTADGKEAVFQKIAWGMMYENIENIISCKYLDDITNSDGKEALVKKLVDCYTRGVDDIQIVMESLVKTQKGEKPTFYCSDKEVNAFIIHQKTRLERQDYSNLYEFLQIIDSIFDWSSVLGLDISDIGIIAKKKIPELYWEYNKGKTDQLWSLGVYDAYLSSEALKEILHSLETETKKIYRQHIVEEFAASLELKDDAKSLELLLALQKTIQRSSAFNATPMDNEWVLSTLCNDLLLPVGSCTEKEYYRDQIAYTIAMDTEKDEYMKYLQSAKHRFSGDKMFLERMRQIELAYEETQNS